MAPRRVRPRMRQTSLFEPLEQPVLQWDKLPEEARQEAMGLLTQLLRQSLRGESVVSLRGESVVQVGKAVTDE